MKEIKIFIAGVGVIMLLVAYIVAVLLLTGGFVILSK